MFYDFNVFFLNTILAKPEAIPRHLHCLRGQYRLMQSWVLKMSERGIPLLYWAFQETLAKKSFYPNTPNKCK